MHADINGSFNIVRKVLKSFHYDKEKISLSYNLVELNLQGKNKFYAFCGPLAKSHSGFYPLWNMPDIDMTDKIKEKLNNDDYWYIRKLIE